MTNHGMIVEKIRVIKKVLGEKHTDVVFLRTQQIDGEKYFIFYAGAHKELVKVADRWKPEKILAYVEINKLKRHPVQLRHYKMGVFLKCMVQGIIPPDADLYFNYSYTEMREMLKGAKVSA